MRVSFENTSLNFLMHFETFHNNKFFAQTHECKSQGISNASC
jgi:hypothetical protein